jgi:hypothetical protein
MGNILDAKLSIILLFYFIGGGGRDEKDGVA